MGKRSCTAVETAPLLQLSEPMTGSEGPTNEELAKIETEWPAIEADLAELDAEIRALGVAPVENYWRRARRVEARASRAVVVALRPRTASLRAVA